MISGLDQTGPISLRPGAQGHQVHHFLLRHMQGPAQLDHRDRLRSRLAQLGKQAAVEEQGVQLLPQISLGSEVRPIFRQNLPGPLRGPVQRPEQLRGKSRSSSMGAASLWSG